MSTHSLDVPQLIRSSQDPASSVAPEQLTMTTPRGQSQSLESGQGVPSTVNQQGPHPVCRGGRFCLSGGDGPGYYPLWGN